MELMKALKKPTPNQLCWGSVAALAFLISFTYLLRPISDLDFFWHLKTGEWIWQNGHLPTSDPFTFTGPVNPNSRQLLILQGYPLAQLLYYGLHQVWGWAGIYLLRFILVSAFLLVFMARFSLSGIVRHSWLLVSALLMLFSVLCLERYPLERPQVFSFLYFAVLLLLYEWIVSGGYRRPLLYIVLPCLVLMTVWGNTHGGSILGLVILTVIAIAETVLFFLKRREKKQFLAIVSFVLVGIAGCLLNGNRLDLSTIAGLLNAKSSKFYIYNYEFFSTWQFYQSFSDNNILFFWGLLALVVALICFTKPIEKLGEVLILIAVGIYACLSIRYIPFFVIAAIPFVYAQLIRPGRMAPLKYGVTAAALLLFAFSVFDEIDNASLLKKNGAVSSSFPVAAADFLVASDLQGRLFNPYDWGGYLLWRLYPQRKIYQDNRALDEQVFMDWLSTLIKMRGSSGRPLWQEVMDKYDIRVAILPKFSEEQKGRPHELSLAMLTHPQWRMLYHDSQAIVFQREK